jgi:hypothetical protein
MMSFRLPGWGGVLQTNLLVEQQRLPCQAGLQPHSRHAKQPFRKETHHQKACPGDLLAPGIGRVNGKNGPGMHCKND